MDALEQMKRRGYSHPELSVTGKPPGITAAWHHCGGLRTIRTFSQGRPVGVEESRDFLEQYPDAATEGHAQMALTFLDQDPSRR